MGQFIPRRQADQSDASERARSAAVRVCPSEGTFASFVNCKSRSILLRRTRWLDGTHDDPRKINKIMEQTLQTLLHRVTRPPLPRPHHRSPALSSLIWSLSSSSTHPHSFALSQQSSSSSSTSSLPSSRSRIHTTRPTLPSRTPHHATHGQTRSASTMRQPKQTFAKREAKLAAEDMDEEEQLRQMQRVLANEDRVQIDMWASKMDTLGPSLQFLLNLLQMIFIIVHMLLVSCKEKTSSFRNQFLEAYRPSHGLRSLLNEFGTTSKMPWRKFLSSSSCCLRSIAVV